MFHHILLERHDTGPQGTFGKMILPDFNKSYYSCELPWINNAPRISCIPDAAWNLEHKYCLPEGEYEVKMRKSPKFGWVYWISNVPMRSLCLIHAANLAGDTTKGYKTQLEGCIALGFSLGWIDKQKAILRSRPAVVEFMNVLEKAPFLLKIVNMFDIVK